MIVALIGGCVEGQTVSGAWATAVAGLGGGAIGALGSFGGVWIKGRYDTKSELRQAERAAKDARTERRRQAYLRLVVAARAVLRNQRQLQHPYSLGATDAPGVSDFIDQGGDLIDALTEAVGEVEIVGSTRARERAIAIYDFAKATSDLFVQRSLALAAAGATRGGAAKLPAFDSSAVATSTAELNGAIVAFINDVRADLAGLPPVDVRVWDRYAAREKPWWRFW